MTHTIQLKSLNLIGETTYNRSEDDIIIRVISDLTLSDNNFKVGQYFDSFKQKEVEDDELRPNNFKVDTDNYEFALYLEIDKRIDKGVVTLKDSFNYKSLNDELIDLNIWQKDKEKLINEVSSQLLTTDFDKLMSTFKDLLDNRHKGISKKINKGINDKIKIKYNTKGEILR